ncbi:WYL domain-containing protein, partial [Streptomyces phyllanthi]
TPTRHSEKPPRSRGGGVTQFGTAGTRALDGAGPPDDDGWVEVEMPVESRAVAVTDLLRLGTEAEVLGPPKLRQAVAEAVGVLAERYGAAPARVT